MKHPKMVDRSERIPRTKSNIVKCPKCGKEDIELDMLQPTRIDEKKLVYLCPGEGCHIVLRQIFQRVK